MKPEGQSSRRFWIWGFILLFGAHVGAIFWLASRWQRVPKWENPPPFFYFSLDEKSDQRLAEATGFRDPTLFALPHANGFSGQAWRSLPPEPAPATHWSAPPEWLPLSEEQLGYSLRSYVLTNRPVQAQWLALLRPDPAPRVRIPDEPLAPRTTLTVSGALAQRKLARQPALPAVPHSDVLGRTVVEVSVNGEGLVETAVVARESISKLADTNALILARAVEFEPLPIGPALARATAPPTLGRIIFSWAVPTNLPVATTATAGPTP